MKLLTFWQRRKGEEEEERKRRVGKGREKEDERERHRVPISFPQRQVFSDSFFVVVVLA